MQLKFCAFERFDKNNLCNLKLQCNLSVISSDRIRLNSSNHGCRITSMMKCEQSEKYCNDAIVVKATPNERFWNVPKRRRSCKVDHPNNSGNRESDEQSTKKEWEPRFDGFFEINIGNARWADKVFFCKQGPWYQSKSRLPAHSSAGRSKIWYRLGG